MEQAASLLTEIFGWSLGISSIVAIAIGAIWSIYFNRIKEKQQAEFSKQLEILKAKNEKINYISKTQFDAEFKMYQELSQYSFQMLLAVKVLFPYSEGILLSNDNDKQKKKAEQLFKDAAEAFMKFQEVLYKNAPFISKEIYSLFENFKQENQSQIDDFRNLKFDPDKGMREEYLSHAHENYKKNFNLSKMHDEIIEELREYLKTLKVMDGTNE